MRLTTLALLLCSLLFAPACGSRGEGTQTAQPVATPAPSATQQSAVVQSATCALLSASDIESVQGEKYTDAQGSEHLTDGLITSQCFYRMPTFDKSISLEVIRLDPKSGAQDAVKKFWREKFHPEAVEKRERERERREEQEREHEKELEREKASGKVRERGYPKEREKEGEEEDARPQRVAGLGEAAFWSGSEMSGALSVLKNDMVIRVSIGGAEETPAKIKRASALARKILTHF